MERKERRVLQLLVLSAMLLPLSSISQGDPSDSSMTLYDDNVPVIPTGYAFANEVGGEIISIRTGPNGLVYPLTSTGCLACLDMNGTVLWRRYYHNVDYLDYHVFSNGNLVIFSDRLQFQFTNGSVLERFEGSYSSELRFRTFGENIVFFENTRKMHCMDRNGSILWTFHISPITMSGMGNDEGDYDIKMYEIRNDIWMTDAGETLAVIYDDDHYGMEEPEPSLFVRLDCNGRIVSWFEFEDYPLRNFEILYDGSIVVTEKDLDTEEYFAVRINKSGDYRWKVPLDDYSSKMVIDGGDGRVLYYRLMADYDEENLIFLYDMEGNRIFDRKVLPRTVTDVLVIGSHIMIADMMNGSLGDLKCYDRNMELVWERTIEGGISSNLIDAGDGTFFLLGNVSNLQRWTVGGDLLWEVKVCTFDNIYMNSHMESLMDYEIGYVFVLENIAFDDRGNIFLGLMRLYKIDKDGKMIWDRTFDGVIESSPIEGVNGDVIIGGMDGYLYSFDKSGGTNWAVEIGSPIGSIPLLNVSNDGYIVIDSMGSMRMVNPDGAFKWTCRLNGSVYTQHIQDRYGNIYAVTWPGTFYSIYPNGSVNWTLVLDRTVSTDMYLSGEDKIYFFEWGDLMIIDLLNRSFSTVDYGDENHFYSGPVPLGNGEMVGINDTVVWFDMEGNILRYCPDFEYLGYSCIEIGPDGRIFVGEGNSGKLHCVLPNGSLDWSIYLGERNVRPRMFANGTLLVACEGLSRIDPVTGEVIWNFMMDFRTHIQGYTETLPYVMEDGSILFAFDRVYRFTDSDTRGQMSDLEMEPYCSWDNVYWEFDIPPAGGFLSGFTIFKNGTDGVLREYMNVPFHQTRIDENKFTNSSLVYDYRVEWHDHLGNGGTTRVFNTSEDYGNYIDITPSGSEPRNLTLSFKDGKVHMDWEPPEDVEEYPVYSYRIYRYEDKEWVLVAEVSYNVTHYEDSNISLYEGYWYSIVACTEHGESEGSDSRYIYTRGDLDETFLMIMGVVIVIYLALVVAGLAYVMGRNDKPTFFDENGDPITTPKGVR